MGVCGLAGTEAVAGWLVVTGALGGLDVEAGGVAEGAAGGG